MKTVFGLLFIFFCGIAYTQTLIPRSLLFDEARRAYFSPSGDGQSLFYQNFPNERNLLYEQKAVGGKPVKIQLPDELHGLAAFDAEKMIVATGNSEGDQLHFLENGQLSKNLLPDSLSRIAIHLTLPIGAVLKSSMPQSQEERYFLLLPSGEITFLLNSNGFQDYYFDARANPIARQRAVGGGGFEIQYKREGAWQTLAEFQWSEGRFLGGLQKVVSVSNDGENIYFTDNRETDKNELKAFDIPNEKLRTVSRSQNTDVLPMGALLNTHHEPAIAVSIFAKSQQHLVDPAYEEDLAFLQRNITGDLSFAGQSWDGNILLIREFTGGPQNFYRYYRQTKKLEFLMSEMPQLERLTLAKRTAFSVKTSDGFDLPIHVYLPPGTDSDQNGIPDKPLPTVLYVHGGPWVGLIHFNSWMHTRNYQLLANRGYAVVVCEFRGTTGLGKKLLQASYKTWGTDMTRDKKEIADWLVQQNIADKDKIGIWGWSYGGYAALAGLAFYPKTYACGISMYGPSALQADSAAAGYNDPHWNVQVGDPATEQEMLRDQSPLYHVENFEEPVLLTTGSRDNRVPQRTVDDMADALHQAGKEVIYFYYPEESHDYRDQASWVSFWALGEQFLQQHLEGSAQPIGDDLQDANFKMLYGKEKYPELNNKSKP